MKVIGFLLRTLRKLTLESYTYKFSHLCSDENYLEALKVKRGKEITIIEDENNHVRFYVGNKKLLLGFFSFGQSLIEIRKMAGEYTFKITFRTYQILTYVFLLFVYSLLIYKGLKEYSGLNEDFIKSFLFGICFLLFFPRFHFMGLIYPKFSKIKKFLLLDV